MSKPDQPSKVSLEDLLRLKRAERPDAGFWTNFEGQLRQKQLTALVQKRRWWHEWSVLRGRRVYLPAGAAAIVAFTLVTVRYAAPARITQTANPASEIAVTDSAIELLPATELSDSTLSQPGRFEEPVAIASVSAPALQAARDTVASAPAVSFSRETEMPTVRALVANFTRLGQAEPDLVPSSTLGSRLFESVREQPSIAQAEVASMTTVSGSKYRLIARYKDRPLSPAPAAPAAVTDRLARRLGDDLGDDISRVGVVGSRVSLKF